MNMQLKGCCMNQSQDAVPCVTYEAITDEAFLRLWHESCEHFVTWDEFKQLEMPPGADAREVWNAICLLRRWSGIDVGLDETRQMTFWANLPHRERIEAGKILARCSATSELGRFLAARGYVSVGVEGQVNELVNVLKSDGYPITYESARACVVNPGIQPRSPAGQLSANYCRCIADEFKALTAQPGHCGVTDIFSQLIQGICLEEPKWDLKVLSNLERCLAGSSSSQNSDGVDMICSSRYILGAARNIFVVSSLQQTLCSLLRKLYFIRCGYPVLSLLPLSAVALEGSAPKEKGLDFDFTQGAAAYLEALKNQLCDLEADMREELDRLNGMRLRIESSALLNMRQKSVLFRLVENPADILDFDSLATEFQSSYHSARTDLNKLVNMGLLYTTNDGRHLLFHKTPDFESAVYRL